MSQLTDGQMTVLIRINGGTWYPKFVTVRISDRCPICGGSRGKPERRTYYEDGERYAVDNWENLCGHLDKYDTVYAEARAQGQVL